MPDLVEIGGFLDGATLERIRDEMRAAGRDAATVLGSGTSPARKSTRVAISDATSAEVTGMLAQARASVADDFGRALDACEVPQFLLYEPGDYFVAHQDGNTPLVHDDSRFRKVSVVIFLSDPARDYEGGALVLDPFGDRRELTPPAGTLIAFPSETTHEVMPITVGERLSIVSWYRRHDAPATTGS